MTGKPILFSGPMVLALLDGRKTQTRRVINPQPRPDTYEVTPSLRGPAWWDACYRTDTSSGADWIKLPYAVGTKLWVREAWGFQGTRWVGGDDFETYLVRYHADGQEVETQHPVDRRDEYFPNQNVPAFEEIADAYDREVANASWLADWWKRKRKVSPIYMPRWASRMTLIVTEVRIERLQDIGELDAKAEGPAQHPDWPDTYHATWHTAFRQLWDGLNVKRGFGWEANPWVAAYTFTVHHANIDAPELANA